MKFRWTIEQLNTMSDNRILRGIVQERRSELNPMAPLYKRLSQLYAKLSAQIERER